MPNNAELVALLLDKASKEGEFLLSSGARRDFYLDAKRVTYDPDGIALIGEMMMHIVRDFDIGRQVEGVSPRGNRVAIVDDVITSGNSVLKAVDAAREVGADVVRLDWLIANRVGPKQYGPPASRFAHSRAFPKFGRQPAIGIRRTFSQKHEKLADSCAAMIADVRVHRVGGTSHIGLWFSSRLTGDLHESLRCGARVTIEDLC